MKCPNCQHENLNDSKFCSGCGTKLTNSSSKQGVPAWAIIVLSVCFIAIGGLGYAYWDFFSNKNSATYSEINGNQNLETQIQQVSSEELTKKQEAHAQQVDRVTLIKEIQQKVFTILTNSAQGSGFLYKKGGYVITNAHVVQGAVEVMVRNSVGQESPGTVVGISNRYDIALIHVPNYQDKPPLGIETTESPIGLEVIAFGSPQGFENSASIGYITGNKRDMKLENFIYKQIYQVDAQIDKGSSGGPLVDVNTGNVIGINSLLYTTETSTHFAFSIPLYSMVDQFDGWIAQPLSANEVLSVANLYENNQQPVSKSDITNETDNLLAGQFVQAFRLYYEMALNEGDFYWIADMLAPSSSAYKELEKYINEIAYQGNYFYFTNNEVLDVQYSNGQYYVDMNETFDFYDAQGNYQFYDRYKTYTVITDEYGAYKIATIKIH
ncbi:trypsin-like peptidase domain-containing protein [Lysinibacillus sp. RSDA_15]|uniref:trypsin-like peptidase domain-containing protein n=1 Tax=Lysinibacillus TaxID=400634 RepID=UPI0018CE2D7C|nr:trypsin-like peptidase domain-containing protein [Lysinibacillus sphaericus]MBG9756168.1 serine protease [Lysinibacillus sphaericus]QTB12817.1 trypsin-like peptidase domain-containing protein [Lysinibacillus sphaericus]